MNHTGSRIHDECWEQLPWLVNERLGARETARLEVHLRECAACREELAAQQRLRQAIRENDAIVLAPQTSLQKLMQRIDASEAASEELDAARSAAPQKHRRWRPSRTGWLAIAAGIQGVAIAALLSMLWLTAPRFATLSSSQPLPQGAVIRVVFAEGTVLDEVNRVLRSIDAQIVAGPSEAGVYTLGLGYNDAAHDSDAQSASRLDAALSRLRANEGVVFAEAAVARTEAQ